MLLMGAGLILPVAAAAAQLNVKPGLWEVNMTSESSGQMPIPESMLARLTPEQRARVAAAMQSQMNRPTAHVYKSCVTRADLDKPFGMDRHDAEENCTDKVLSKSSTSMTVDMECTGKFSVSSIYRWKALSPESVSGTMERTVSQGGHSMKSTGHFTGKWLGADCRAIK